MYLPSLYISYVPADFLLNFIAHAVKRVQVKYQSAPFDISLCVIGDRSLTNTNWQEMTIQDIREASYLNVISSFSQNSLIINSSTSKAGNILDKVSATCFQQ